MATIQLLVIGGGGGGGNQVGLNGGGGGGGGGYQYNAAYTVTQQSYSVTIGAGGGIGSNGNNSVFDAVTALGGGAGGTNSGAGSNGGCGGGNAGGNTGGTGTGSQGGNGGVGGTGIHVGGGGGGGAGGNGGAGGGGTGGTAGAGTSNSITGSPVTYAAGGLGGYTSPGTAGPANTGNGGGGGNLAAIGGSGIVIIAFHTDGSDGVTTNSSASGSYTVTTSGLYTIYTFTGNGTFIASTSFVAPIVTTQACTSIGATSLTGNGTIVNDGGVAPTKRGICYVQGSGTPTTADSKVEESGTFGTGTFSESVTGLTTLKLYSFRAYAINSQGTSYGGVFRAVPGMTVQALVIGGGGGGGTGQYPTLPGGGGGAGGFQYDSAHSVIPGNYAITVGAGGLGTLAGFQGGDGGNSVFDSLTSIGGGGGGGVESSGGGGVSHQGDTGGSGGGSGYNFTPGGLGTGGQGNNGAAGASNNAGGGGGAGAVGSGINGGNGSASSITGASVTYAGGGGALGGTGGTGGGGAGSFGTADATANTGSGGGGLGYNNVVNGQRSGNGGSGVVIIAYHFNGSDGIDPASTGGVITSYGAGASKMQVHTFNASGTFTVVLVASVSTSDSTTVSESLFIETAQVLSGSESISVADSVSMRLRVPVLTFADLAASLVTSAYKWLTQTLYNTQQGQTVRPYFTAQIIDDTIQPKVELFSGAGTPAGNGTMAVAPDGTAFAVGLDGSNNLKVYRAPNLDAVAGVWPNSTALNTTGDNFLDSRNIYSINISDYYQGSYRICVWYFGNFLNDGSNLTVVLHYSNDGGLTFTKRTFTPAIFSNSSIENLSLASMKPVFSKDGNMKMGVFYIKKNGTTFTSSFKGYDIFYIYGDIVNGFSTDISWGRQANSGDWTIHSVGSYYLNGKHYCTFSGFRNILDSVGVNQNYSLWTASLLNLTGVAGKDLWSAPISLMPVGSASSTNQNQFTLPWATVFNGLVYLTAMATLVDSVSQTSQGATAQVVTTNTNYILLNSDDGKGFSYPTVLIGSSSDEFDSGGIASFILQNGFWFLGGSAWLWEFTQNNIVADVSNDVIGFTISDVAGQPSSIQLQIGNANNKWVGASPTGPGASAITKNKKIAIWQGYYNPDGTTELVPHSTYYIDDINQTITGINNDVNIVGRDFYKKLKTTITKFSYQYNGPTFFSDIFDGTFISSWNQVAGTWKFEADGNSGIPDLELIENLGESKIMLVNANANSYGHLMRLFFAAGGIGTFYVYGFYIDDSNYLRLELNLADGQSWSVVLRVNAVNTTLDSGTMPLTMSPGLYYGVYVRRYNYFTFNFMIDGGASMLGNSLVDFNPSTISYAFKGSGTGDYDLKSSFTGNSSLQKFFTVGFGINYVSLFVRFFSFTTLANQNNLGSVMRKIARVAGIFAFKISYTWRELLFNPSFTGTFSVLNRTLNITAGNQAIANNNSMANGEISFLAKCTVADNTAPAGFRFSFRNGTDGGGAATYYLHVLQASNGSSNPPVFCRFERLFNGTVYQFYNTPYDVSNNPQSLGSENVNLSQYNVFKVVMIDGWFHAFINDVMVGAWNDNNTDINYLTTGQWGFLADANTSLQVTNILAPNFWKPVQVFSLNPGDDAESAIEHLIASLRAWFFSDLMSRFKAIFLSSNNASTYNYNTQLFQQNVDQSDKEYVSQVTVYGDGVIATSRNTNLMPGVQVREEVIVDYTITTQQDAQTRADNEIINSNQYRNQYSPKQVINVGAELFDAVTIINTGNNTSGVDEVTRVYAQRFVEGGGNNNSDYSLEIETGNL